MHLAERRPPEGDLTHLLLAFSAGDTGAADRVLPLVYEELRRIAEARLRGELAVRELSTTELVHEAYVRLVDVTRVTWTDRAHFYAVASIVMRRLLVDWARARRAGKRGGAAPHVTLAAAEMLGDLAEVSREDHLLALDDALRGLARRSERQARVVECRYFVGLSIEETAAALGVSASTVRADWRLARAWLFVAMRAGVDGP